MGRNTWVVFVKSGNASLMVVGSGVFMSMKDMEGRSRTICAFGKVLSFSCSRYLPSVDR